TRPRSHSAEEEARYGLGFWLGEYDDSIELRGYDAGVSFHAVHQPSTGTTYSIIANWTDGAWPLARLLTATFAPAA
ncbi:MAG TPA: hypothetical protein PLV68_11190, partial [Ilumatobacteraceae bacterium]|nr:hypothetical protein [Ilumatobacteraceae bacterium]